MVFVITKYLAVILTKVPAAADGGDAAGQGQAAQGADVGLEGGQGGDQAAHSLQLALRHRISPRSCIRLLYKRQSQREREVT